MFLQNVVTFTTIRVRNPKERHLINSGHEHIKTDMGGGGVQAASYMLVPVFVHV
jgi:hypothetical protein